MSRFRYMAAIMIIFLFLWLFVIASIAVSQASTEKPQEEAEVVIEFYGNYTLQKGNSLSMSTIESKQDSDIESLGISMGKVLDRYTKNLNAIRLKMTKTDFDKIKDNHLIKHASFNITYTFDSSLGVTMINADKLWEVNDSYNRPINGTGVKIAILDTGVDYTHPNFGPCTKQQIWNGTCQKIAYMWDFAGHDNDSMDNDNNGHGTHVAGIVGGMNSTYPGVAPNSTFYVYGVYTQANALDAIQNATANNVDVITMSFGWDGYTGDDGLETALRTAHDTGIIIIASAGNTGPIQLYSSHCPACYDFVISVGSNDFTETISAFSTRGWTLSNATKINNTDVDVLAPGNSIYSSTKGGGFTYLSGTSFSAPHVAGLAALLKQAHPIWNNTQIESAIINSAISYGSDIQSSGAGRVDALRAYNISGGFNKPITFGGQNNIITKTGNYTYNFTFSITGLNRNDSYNISCVNYTAYLKCNTNISNINVTVNDTKYVYVNVTIDNTLPHYGTESGKINVTSVNSTMDLTIPFSVWNLVNTPNCPVYQTNYTTSTILPSGLTCSYWNTTASSFTAGYLIVGENNVTLDCNGSTFVNLFIGTNIRFNDPLCPPLGVGISVIKSNVTINNCSFIQMCNDIYVYGGKNITITNITSFGSSYSIRLANAVNGTIISNSNFSSQRYAGVYIDNAWNATIEKNIFPDGYHTISAEDKNPSYANHFITIRNNVQTNSYLGDVLDSIYNLTMSNETFNNSRSLSMNLISPYYADINNITIDYDRILHYYTSGITLENDYSGYPETNGITFKKINVRSPLDTLHVIGSLLKNTKFYDSTFTTTDSGTNDISAASESQSTFVNCTYTDSKLGVSGTNTWIIISWYGYVNVTDITKKPVSEVTVTIYENSSGSWIVYNSNLTDMNGMAKIEIPQFKMTSAGRNYYSVNMTANKQGYAINFTSDSNVTANKNYNITLLTAPNVTIMSPVNGFSYSNSIINISYSVTDNQSATLPCYYVLDSVTALSPNSPISNNTIDSLNKTVADGSHSIYIVCSNGNVNGTSSIVTFSVSTSIPQQGGGGGGYTPCIPSWNCTSWSNCFNNTQIRNCMDMNRCGSNSTMPNITQPCSIFDVFRGNETFDLSKIPEVIQEGNNFDMLVILLLIVVCIIAFIIL